jgi:hypothetical protein
VHLPVSKYAALLVLIISVTTGLAAAQKIRTYTFVVGSGFLCGSSDSTCPAIAKAGRGDSYEFSGAGTFDSHDGSVKAAGTFTHKSASGHVLQAGVWIASNLVSFVSYGAAPGALLQETRAFSLLQFDPRPMKIGMLSGPMPTGGLAVFRVRLLPTSGPPRSAVLHMNCALGEVPPEHSAEGVQLSIEGKGGEYGEAVSGRVMFLGMAPGSIAPAGAPRQEPALPSTPPRQ